jgi:NADPH:quinone reductase-like Zn-dependent oxidoreductase
MLGLFDDDALSWEFTGVVSKVGEDVTRVKPGDRVIGLGFSRFNRYVRVHELLTETLEETESFEVFHVDPIDLVAPNLCRTSPQCLLFL